MLAWTEPVNHQVDHRYEDHCLAALGQRLIVFRQSAVAAQPRERTFDDPALRQNFKSVLDRPLDDFHDAPIPSARPPHEPAGIAAVREDQLHPPQAPSQLLYQRPTPVAILNVGWMHTQREDQSEGVHDHMTLAPLDFLARVVSPRPPFSAVLTDWLSRMPTLGVGFLPALRRTLARRAS